MSFCHCRSSWQNMSGAVHSMPCLCHSCFWCCCCSFCCCQQAEPHQKLPLGQSLQSEEPSTEYRPTGQTEAGHIRAFEQGRKSESNTIRSCSFSLVQTGCVLSCTIGFDHHCVFFPAVNTATGAPAAAAVNPEVSSGCTVASTNSPSRTNIDAHILLGAVLSLLLLGWHMMTVGVRHAGAVQLKLCSSA